MIKNNRCDICKEYIFIRHETHKCNPIFYVQFLNWCGEEWQEQRGYDHEDVAIKFAKSIDTDHELMDGEERISVKDKMEGGTTKHFDIGSELTIDYWANEINEFK